MKQWWAKLRHRVARFAVRRKPAATADHAATNSFGAGAGAAPPQPHPASASAIDSPAAPVAVTGVTTAPNPIIDDDALGDGLAELGDPVAAPIDSVDVLFADGLAGRDAPGMPVQNETISSEALYTPQPTDGLAEYDALSDPGPFEQALPASVPFESEPAAGDSRGDALLSDTPSDTPALPRGLVDAVPADGSEAPTTSRMRGLLAGVRLSAERIRQFKLKDVRLKGVVPLFMGAIGRKRIWIPGVSLALLGVVGTLAFMLAQSSSEKTRLQADLTAAKQALKKAGATPGVAVIPPLLAVPAPPAQEPPPPALQVAAVQLAPEPVRVASVSSTRAPVQMDCDVSDKASVSLNLKRCIEAFNQATGR